MFRFSLFAIILSTATAWPVRAEEPLEAEILKITEGADARVGVALIVDGQDTLTVNNDYGYPLMSVMKLHQAIAVTSYLEEKGRSLDEATCITSRDLKPDTWSPLRDRYPEGNVRMSIRELLCYTLQQSDNNACDILFSRVLGTEGVDSLLRTAGVKDFAIAATEDAMHRELSRCQDNWSTPLSTAEMLDRLVAGRLLWTKTDSSSKRCWTAGRAQTAFRCRFRVRKQESDTRQEHPTSERTEDGRESTMRASSCCRTAGDIPSSFSFPGRR